MAEDIKFCDLTQILFTANSPHFLGAKCSPRDIDAVLRKMAYDSNWNIDYRKVHSERMYLADDFFNELSAVYQFPEYFGNNWDALNECMNDLDWINSKNFVLLLLNFEISLSKEKLTSTKILMRILYNTCLNWEKGSEDGFQKSNIPFHVIIHTNTNLDDVNRLLLGLIGVEPPVINMTDCLSALKSAQLC